MVHKSLKYIYKNIKTHTNKTKKTLTKTVNVIMHKMQLKAEINGKKMR